MSGLFTDAAREAGDNAIFCVRLAGYAVIAVALADRIGWLDGIAVTFAFIELRRAISRPKA